MKRILNTPAETLIAFVGVNVVLVAVIIILIKTELLVKVAM